MKAKIKVGTTIYQDFGVSKWPICSPPLSEYGGEEYLYQAKNPNMIFDVEWKESRGGFWCCSAPGYGEIGNYGNGSIYVMNKAGIEEVICNPPTTEGLAEKLKNALQKIADLDYTEHSTEKHEWAEADCFHKAQAIAREALK